MMVGEVYLLDWGIAVSGEGEGASMRRIRLFNNLVGGPDARAFMLDGPRYVWWNFVSSNRDRIEQAKADWREGRFPKVPGDEEEFIPIPDVPKTISYP